MNRRTIIIISLVFLPFFLNAQKESSSELFKQAVELNAEGSYDRAVKMLKKVLEKDKNSPAAQYELAYALLHTGKPKEAVKYSNRIIRQGDSLKLEAYLLLGAAYGQLGDARKSLKIYDKAVHEFPGNNLALFNLGLSYYNNNDLDMAERSLIRSIDVDNSYPGSHYLMAHVMLRKGETVKAMLALYYFLLLEQDTPRAEESYDMLVELWKSGVNSDDGSKIVSIDKNADDFYKMLDLEIKLKTDSYEGKFEPDERLKVFTDNTRMFFNVISQKYKRKIGFWEHTYLDFFNDLNEKGFTDSFAYYISNTKYRPQVLVWLSGHYQNFNQFIKWIELRLEV